jgi:hypothetical protein
MKGLKFSIVTLAAVLASLAGLTYLAMAQDGGVLRGVARHLHGGTAPHGGGHHEKMAQIIEQLELRPEQHRHVERIHELMEATHHGSGAGSMAELHERIVTQCMDGEVTSADLRLVVDAHVEQVRGVLYAITDEFAALVEGLDARQREILQEHLRERPAPDAS